MGKLLVIFIVLFLALSAYSEVLESAMSKIISKVYEQKTEKMRCIDFINRSESFEMKIILAKIWSEIYLKVKIFDYLVKKQTKAGKVSFGIMIFDNQEAFLETFQNINFESFDSRGLYVIIFTKEVDVSSVFSMLWKKSLFDANILMPLSENSIGLLGYHPFKDHHCGEATTIIINRYVNNTWENQIFFPKKFDNFHNCPIKVTAAEAVTAFYEVKYKNGTLEHKGSDVEMLKALSEKLNFTLEIHYSSNLNDWGDILDNGTGYGLIDRVKSRYMDFIMGHTLKLAITKYLDFSVSYSFYYGVIIIPPGAPYTSIENLMRPFSLPVWIGVVSTFICSIFVIFILQLQSPKVRNWFFEKDGKNSYYNLLMIIVGGTMKIPKGYFPRLLIMTFIIFCLIMRTVYQSNMFNYLQAGDNKSRVKNIKEMGQRGFNIYMAKGFAEYSDIILKYPPG